MSTEDSPAAPPVAKRRHLRRLLRRPLAVAAMVVLAIVALLMVAGPVLAPYDPAEISITERLEPPSGEHLLGTDAAGRDQLSRLMAGAQLSVGSGMLVLAVALALGVSAALYAGYRGGSFDTVATWVVGLLMALPAIVVLVAARTVIGSSLVAMTLLLGLFLAPVYYRIVYGSVRGVRNELYVDAARVSGLSDTRIVGRHVLAAVRAPIIVQSSLLAGAAVAILAGLEFIGLGEAENPTWGGMLATGYQRLYSAPWLVIWPAVALSLTSMAFVLLGNALRDELQGTSGIATRRSRRSRGKRTGPNAAVATPATPAPDPIVHADEPGTPEHAGTIVDVRDLRVSFELPDGENIEVVHGVSLELRRGEIHGLMGESGSGKTQTALAVLGLLARGGHVNGGEILFDGEHLEHANEKTYEQFRGRHIGYIPQEPMTNLDPSFTIGGQLTYPLVKCRGMTKRDARARALSLLERVGIDESARTFASHPFEVSGGMAQRILIAGAISMDPEVLIADEPTTALDVTVQADVLDLLRDLQEERQLTMLLVTHDVGVVADLCDRVTVMQDGAFVERGPVRSVLRSPRHPYTKSLLSKLLDDAPPRLQRSAAGTTQS